MAVPYTTPNVQWRGKTFPKQKPLAPLQRFSQKRISLISHDRRSNTRRGHPRDHGDHKKRIRKVMREEKRRPKRRPETEKRGHRNLRCSAQHLGKQIIDIESHTIWNAWVRGWKGNVCGGKKSIRCHLYEAISCSAPVLKKK